jgi:hypothetical protein
MKKDEKNFSGRIIPPWYDSDGLCFLILYSMILIFIFSVSGIFTALKSDHSDLFIKIPVLLCTMSFYLIVSVLVRLIKRRKINKSLSTLDFYRG